jgi:hypothetical protein
MINLSALLRKIAPIVQGAYNSCFALLVLLHIIMTLTRSKRAAAIREPGAKTDHQVERSRELHTIRTHARFACVLHNSEYVFVFCAGVVQRFGA